MHKLIAALAVVAVLLVPTMATADTSCPGTWDVDIGNTTSESSVVMNGWGPIEPANSGGNYGGVDDCRVVWETTEDPCADITFQCCECANPLELSWSALEGIGDDSYEVKVDGVTVFTYNDPDPSDPAETWVDETVDLTVFGLPNQMQHVVEFCATGVQWEYFDTYGQVAFDWVQFVTEPCSGNDEVDLTVEVQDAHCVCIDVTPSSLDFGSVQPGTEVEIGNALTVSNCGDVDVTVEASATDLFNGNLEFDSGGGWAFLNMWSEGVAVAGSFDVDARLGVPVATPPGTETGTLTFWVTPV